jgi:error-prone DNA polymerase
VRLGLRYVKGLRQEAAEALVRERKAAAEGGCATPFDSITDLVRRVPQLRKPELVMLANIGALNSVARCPLPVASKPSREEPKWKPETGNWKLPFHRRDALWQVARAARAPGPLLAAIPERDAPSPLARMSDDERLVADFAGTGLTVGPHPMAYRRAQLKALGVKRAIELAEIPNGRFVRAAGCVIARQRPGTASGFVFLSLEDETGIANAIITPDLFERHRLLLVSEKFLLIEGRLQHQDNVISVKAERVLPLHVTNAEPRSHDFH